MPMRPVTERLSAAGFSRWIRLNRYSSAFGVGLGVKLSDSATLTYSVQHTFDSLVEENALSISRTTTTATVTKVNHGLLANDWISVLGGTDAIFGEYSVASVTDADTFTYTVSNSGATVSPPGTRIITARVFSHETLAGLTAGADGNYAFPPVACRLLVSAYTDGFAELTVVSGGK